MISRHGNMIQPHVTSLLIRRVCVSHIERASECEKGKERKEKEGKKKRRY